MSHKFMMPNRVMFAVLAAMTILGQPAAVHAMRQRSDTAPKRVRTEKNDAQLIISQVLDATSLLALERGRSALSTATLVMDLVTEVAASSGTTERRLSDEETRLLLEAYNAGPYALLRYKGRVPYSETRSYTPKVRRFYRQDLSSNPYDAHILAAARKYWLDPQLVRAVMKAESGFRPRVVSSAGARGVMQVMPCVWHEIRGRYDLSWEYRRDVHDPAKNIEVACAYLAWLRYDFLPNHFAAFDRDPATPPRMVRHVVRTLKGGPRIQTHTLALGRLEMEARSVGAEIARLLQIAEPAKERQVASARRKGRGARTASN